MSRNDDRPSWTGRYTTDTRTKAEQDADAKVDAELRKGEEAAQRQHDAERDAEEERLRPKAPVPNARTDVRCLNCNKPDETCMCTTEGF